MGTTDKTISIWFLANNGLRSPSRLLKGFIVYANSPYIGKLRHENEGKFMALLGEKGVIAHKKGRDPSASMARKFRLGFDRFGLIYHKLTKKEGSDRQDELGPIDEITPFGRSFLKADTVQAIQELYLRASAVEKEEIGNTGRYFSPLRWILAIMLELEKRTGTSELSRLEFALWGHTTNPSHNINEVVDSILELRSRRKLSTAKKRFDKAEIDKRRSYYKGKLSNFQDYANTNMRYLRATGLVQRKGRGIVLVPEKHALTKLLAKNTASEIVPLEAYKELSNGAALPSDDLNNARILLKDLLQQAEERRIEFDLSGMTLDNALQINTARHKLEAKLAKVNEIEYAHKQAAQWKEISDYMTLLIKGSDSLEYDEDHAIDIPQEERATYLEWVMWRALLAIDHLTNTPSEIRGFSLDSDYLPVNFAAGRRGDLYSEFKDFALLTEVTMSSSSRQEAMEGEPVRRHVSDATIYYSQKNKPTYGMFVAGDIDTNTAETFKHGVWYTKDNLKQRLVIVPFTLQQFQMYFEALFKSSTTTPHPERLRQLIQACAEKRDVLDAPGWKKYINDTVRSEVTKILAS